MSDPAFFGYGSLVNIATHDYVAPRPASLHGWRRIWRKTHLRKAAYLSVMPDQGSILHGVIAQVPNADWAALDRREAAYARHDVTEAVSHRGQTSQTAVYQVRSKHVSHALDHPILLSYLDVVVQGYLQVFGNEGVSHFFETTDGWDTPIFDDRADPIYPRHQMLGPKERVLVDDHLAAVVQKAE